MAERPRFLFLLTDDQRYATLSLTGSLFMKTPSIDRIGREGVVLTNCFVTMSLCAHRPVQGKSWRPLVTGKGQGVPWRRAFLYEMFGGGADPAHPTVKDLRTDRYRLILNLNPRELDELYDLQNDPQEMRSLAREKGTKI